LLKIQQLFFKENICVEEEESRPLEKPILATKEYNRTWFGVVAGSEGLLACSFGVSRKNLESHLRAGSPGLVAGTSEQSENALEQMIRLYMGEPTIKTVRLNWEGVSEFRKSVCQVMKEIPKGRVTSYGLIAKRLSSGPRAVGTGVAANPWPLFVPCHRVVPAHLEVGNYSIGGALSDYGCGVKRELLQREGVQIDGDRVASKALWVPGA
jgi:methylated-DNA-[protein]-cysteine S-methyltransferase